MLPSSVVGRNHLGNPGQHLGLHRGVERRGGLVEEEDPRSITLGRRTLGRRTLGRRKTGSLGSHPFLKLVGIQELVGLIAMEAQAEADG